MATKPHGGAKPESIRPSPPATLWLETHPLPTAADKTGLEGATSLAAVSDRSEKRQA